MATGNRRIVSYFAADVKLEKIRQSARSLRPSFLPSFLPFPKPLTAQARNRRSIGRKTGPLLPAGRPAGLQFRSFGPGPWAVRPCQNRNSYSQLCRHGPAVGLHGRGAAKSDQATIIFHFREHPSPGRHDKQGSLEYDIT